MNVLAFGVNQLLRSIRTGRNPAMVALWGGVVVMAVLKRVARPTERRLVLKDLEPGAAYLIRVPKPGEEDVPPPPTMPV